MIARRIAVVMAALSNPPRRACSATDSPPRRSESWPPGRGGGDATADAIELRDYAHDITNNVLTGFAPPALEAAINTVVSSDALIAVTPIFSTSYSGLFTSFVDVLDPDALTGKPVLIRANAGTPRHSLAIDYAIRPLFAYLHADAISTGVFAASSYWGAQGDGVASLGDRIDKATRELADTIARRDTAVSADPFDPADYLGEGRSFGHLLGGLAGE